MNTENDNKRTNPKGMIIGALIGIGFLSMMGAFAGAFLMTFAHNIEGDLPISSSLILIMTVLVLSIAFFISGYISRKISYISHIFDSIIQSLGSWALMAILVMTLALGLLALNAVRNLKTPVLVTNVHISKPNIITKVKPQEEKLPLKEKKKSEEIIVLLAWTAFLSLFFGAGTSIAGGLIAHKNIQKRR